MGLVLQPHQAGTADLVQQLVLVLHAVDPFVQEILKGFGVHGGRVGQALLLGLGLLLGDLGLGVGRVQILGGLVVLLQGVGVVVIVVVALGGPGAVGGRGPLR